MPIRDELQGLDDREKASRKALRLAENAAARLPISWNMGTGQNRTTITVTAAVFRENALVMDVNARKGAWSFADEVRIFNPPIMVPTGRKVPHPDGGLVDEFEENPVQAIRVVVEDVVRLWQGTVTA